MIEKVNVPNVTLVMLSGFLSIFLGMGSYILFSFSATDIIFVVIIGTIVSIPLLQMTKYIIDNNKYENIFELNKNLSSIGKILNFILLIGMYVLALFILFNISDFLNIEYLPESDVGFTKILVILPIIYILSKDLNSILKVNQVLCIISIGLIILDIIGVFGSFEISNLEPLLTTSKMNFFKSIICYICFNGIALSLIALIGKGSILEEGIEDKNKKINKCITKMYIFVNVIQFIIILACILTLGIEYIGVFRFPEYVSLKQFTLFNILERVENILSLQFYFNSISILSFLVFNIVKLLPKSNKIKIYPIFVLISMYLITSIFFKNTVYFVSCVEKYLVLSCYILIILPMILTFIILHKKVNKSV